MQATAVAHPDTQGRPLHASSPRELIMRAEPDFAAARVLHYTALHDGIIAGG